MEWLSGLTLWLCLTEGLPRFVHLALALQILGANLGLDLKLEELSWSFGFVS